MRRRGLWSVAPLALLIALGIPALQQADTSGVPELSISRAKGVIETDVQRRSSSPTVTNEFNWTNFEWKGEGDAILGSAPPASQVRARFAKVNLTWTQTTRTRLGEVVHVITYTTRPIDLYRSNAHETVVQLPEVLAFFKPAQAGWTYKWQEG